MGTYPAAEITARSTQQTKPSAFRSVIMQSEELPLPACRVPFMRAGGRAHGQAGTVAATQWRAKRMPAVLDQVEKKILTLALRTEYE